ncbi:hypothetical protein NQ318_016421 [Aromia moschata]|uniref:Uncharacterized protein n=1 Tax=Aromia moschata TaxID=1265417 RepID=A0AAV8Z5P4_9CUCU|nr:hypothetical protein NQ318_016421 [Aromia moschata]
MSNNGHGPAEAESVDTSIEGHIQESNRDTVQVVDYHQQVDTFTEEMLDEMPIIMQENPTKANTEANTINPSAFVSDTESTETHPDLPPLNQGTISKIEAQHREMGHVRKVPSKRQAVVDDDTKLNLLLALEENPITPALTMEEWTLQYRVFAYDTFVKNVREALARSPIRSARQHACELEMSRDSVRKILRLELKFHPYKMLVVQQLQRRDYAAREDFAVRMQVIWTEDPNSLVRMSDEAHLRDLKTAFEKMAATSVI